MNWININDSMPEDGQPIFALVYITSNNDLEGEFIVHVENERGDWPTEILGKMRWIFEQSSDCVMHCSHWLPADRQLPEFDPDTAIIIR